VKVSIIIPAFNEERLLGESLKHVREAMKGFERLGLITELIVCNNNSTDRTEEIATAAGAKVVFEQINQIGRARNCGAAVATGEWLVFIDADSHPSAALFADVASQILSCEVVAGGSTLRLNGSSRTARFITRLWNFISIQTKWVAGSFIFCEANAFRQVGGFNNELFASEEIDLSKKLKRHARKAKKRIVILDKHPMVTSDRKLHLYTMGEHFRFLARTILAGGKTLNSREDCHSWYDGRR
jgi:glycosyltransferase involved in cell wall biosynthesis